MNRIEVLRKLAQNPHYRMTDKQKAELEVTTQEVRSDDINVRVPKVRRKKRVKRQTNRHTLPEENLGVEIQAVTDLQQLDSES